MWRFLLPALVTMAVVVVLFAGALGDLKPCLACPTGRPRLSVAHNRGMVLRRLRKWLRWLRPRFPNSRLHGLPCSDRSLICSDRPAIYRTRSSKSRTISRTDVPRRTCCTRGWS